jgi:hypothetical protein
VDHNISVSSRASMASDRSVSLGQRSMGPRNGRLPARCKFKLGVFLGRCLGHVRMLNQPARACHAPMCGEKRWRTPPFGREQNPAPGRCLRKAIKRPWSPGNSLQQE